MRGNPRRIASVPAREKLRTDVMDMTVEARHRFKDSRGMRVGSGG